MNTLSDRKYVDAAIAALAECKTDADISGWNDRYASTEQYIHLPDALLAKMENAYEARLEEIDGEALE